MRGEGEKGVVVMATCVLGLVVGASEIEEKCYVMSGFILSFVDACTSKDYIRTYSCRPIQYASTYNYLSLLTFATLYRMLA